MARLALSAHRKFQRFAKTINSRVLARGILETLWEPCWQAVDPYLGTTADIETLCEWKGAPGALTQALLEAGGPKGAGFIEPYAGNLRDTAERHYQVHDFLDHCPHHIRRRHAQERTAGTRPCAFCTETFAPASSKQRFCSHRCRQAAYRVTMRDDRDDTRDDPQIVTDRHAIRDDPASSRVDKQAQSSRIVTDRHAGRHAIVTRGAKSRTKRAISAPRDDRDDPLRSLYSSTVQNSTYNDRTERTCTVRTQASFATNAKPAAGDARDDLDDGPDAPGLDLGASVTHTAPKTNGTNSHLDHTSASLSDAVAVAATALSPIVLTFPVVGDRGPVWHLREDQIARWRELYPGLDVLAEARRALAWIEADKSRRKTYGGMNRCLVTWLNRSIDSPRRGPTVITGSLKTAGNQAAVEEFLRRRNALD